MDDQDKKYLLFAAIAAAAYLWLKKKGVAGAAAELGATAGAGAINAANAATVGVVTGVSQAIGIPTPAQTITDHGACQDYMNANGVWSSAGACSLGAFLSADPFAGASAGSSAPAVASPTMSDAQSGLPFDYNQM